MVEIYLEVTSERYMLCTIVAFEVFKMHE